LIGTRRKPSKREISPAGQLLPVPAGRIDRRIYLVRGQKVIIDQDLAGLYQVESA
jgi:hypothetical protein